MAGRPLLPTKPTHATPHPMQFHPMALQRLAAFFQDQHFQQSGRRKPIVLIGPRRAAPGGAQRCLVVGYEATNRMQVRARGCRWVSVGTGGGGGRAQQRCLVVGYEATNRMQVRARGRGRAG